MNRVLQKPGWPEKAFVVLLLGDIALSFFPAAAIVRAILNIACYILGAIVAIRFARRNLKQSLWRLRNRLIAGYLFIAVVPIALVALLVVSAGYVIMGQVAIYMVNAELERRMAESQALSPELLSDLASNLGDVSVIEWSNGANPDFSVRNLRRHHVPPPENVFDRELTYFAPVNFHSRQYFLVIRSRPSAVLAAIFGAQKMEWAGNILFLSIIVASLFLIVQLTSVLIGVSITRTITGAVNDLYEGTQRVKEGDFSHRIAVRGADQLAELSQSFNLMTENLQRLIVVEKEKERLASELEIARDVQGRLFPKTALSLPSLSLAGICHPAAVVSGDYYDFLNLKPSGLALAIGDVAGKGISAALLMATIQAAMHSQLAVPGPISTARIVSSLNHQIYSNTAPEKYATFFFALYDEATGALTYTNAGHLPPILIRDGAAQRLEVTGTVVGAFPAAQYEERQIQLAPGDLLLAYTDGLTEPENAYGEMFGEERVIEVLMKYESAESSAIFERTLEAVLEWTGPLGLQDDMTMLIARRMSA